MRVNFNKIITTIVVFITAVIFGPAILFFFGWLGGWLAEITIGHILCDGLNSLFGTTRFIPADLPVIGGTFAWIGGFFHNLSTTKDKS